MKAAEAHYTKAIEICEVYIKPLTAAIRPTLGIFYANRAACRKIQNHMLTCEADCTLALHYRPEYAKVMLRRVSWYISLSLSLPHNPINSLPHADDSTLLRVCNINQYRRHKLE